jgi:hypothetical protein
VSVLVGCGWLCGVFVMRCKRLHARMSGRGRTQVTMVDDSTNANTFSPLCPILAYAQAEEKVCGRGEDIEGQGDQEPVRMKGWVDQFGIEGCTIWIRG